MDAGVAMAYSRGFFRENRLAVAVLAPLTPMRPIRYVVEGVDELGVAALPQIALAKEKGAPIVAVGSLVPRTIATFMWLPGSTVRSVADLRGKTVGIPGLRFQREMLKVALRHAGVPPAQVKVVQGRYGLAEKLAKGRVDAIFGGSRALEGVELESRGLDPITTPVGRFGIPPYPEMLWIARSDFASQHPGVIRHFLEAVSQGDAAAIAHPAVAARIVERSVEKNRHLSPADMETAVRRAVRLLSTTAHMSSRRASRLLAWMHANGLIRRQPPVAALQTAQYLPRAGGS